MTEPDTIAASSAAANQSRAIVPAWLSRVARGLLLGAILALALSTWFFSQAEREIGQDRQDRRVVAGAMAVADLASNALSRELSEQQLATLIEEWSAGQPQALGVRILRLSGARLLVSTETGDDAVKAVPRRLSKDEKWLYDLGQELRTAVETNRDEGVFRKRHVDIEALGGNELRVTLPFFIDDAVVGVVQLRQTVEPIERGARTLPAILAVLIPFILLVLLTRFVPALGSETGTDVDSKPWRQFLLAAALYSAGLYGFAQVGLNANDARERVANQDLAANYLALKDQVVAIAGRHELNISLEMENRWDVDGYQRPLGIIGADGELDPRALAEQLERRRGFIGKAAWGNWVSGLILLAFIGLGYGHRLWRTLVEHRDAYLYVTPAMLGMLFLVMFPFAYGVALAFTDMTLFNENLPFRELWVGLKNFVDILFDFDVAQRTDAGWVINYKNFYWTLYITVCWTVFNVAIGVSVGLLVALALNTKGLRGKAIYRILLILPWAVPNYITALTWRGMFHQQFGVINQAIQMFGGEPVAWFDGVFSSFLTGLATNGWLSFPFMMVVILGGLQSISSDMYEAATVEGATKWQQFRHITLPLLKPTLIPAIIISVVWTFNMFNIIFLVSGGEPGGANEILITQAYKIAFEQYQYAYAAAYSVVIFLILLGYGVLQNKISKATEEIA